MLKAVLTAEPLLALLPFNLTLYLQLLPASAFCSSCKIHQLRRGR